MMSSSFSVSSKNSGRWDPETLSEHVGEGNGGFTSKLSSKMSEQLDAIKVVASSGANKVKAAASTGFRRIKESEKFDKIVVLTSKGVEKVKDGASSGFQWIKDKCRKTTHNSRLIV